MAALEQRPVSSSVNGDVAVTLDVAGDMTEEDEEDIQKEVRTIAGFRFGNMSEPITVELLRRVGGVPSDGCPAAVCVGKSSAIRADD